MIDCNWLNSRLSGPPPGRVLHYLLYTEDGERVAPDKFEPWGIVKSWALMANNFFPPDGQGGWDATGWIDEDKTKEYLAQSPRLRPDSAGFIDIESAEWQVAKKVDYLYVSQGQAIEYRIRLLELIHRERPDLLTGNFACVPWDYYDGLMGGQAGEDLFSALKPLAEVSDILFPHFYVEAKLDHADVLDWIGKALQNARTYYPRKEVCPFLWPHYYDQWWEHPELWHLAVHERACRIPADRWREILELVYQHTNSWLWWAGGGGPPWDENAPNWIETQRILTARGIVPLVCNLRGE